MLELLRKLRDNKNDVDTLLKAISSDFYDILELLKKEDKDLNFLCDFCEKNCNDLKTNQMDELANLLYDKYDLLT